jgi:low temperature requirement protein LtrA
MRRWPATHHCCRRHGRPSRGDEQAAERRATWTELFSDLFYVVASAKATEHVVARPGLAGAGEPGR